MTKKHRRYLEEILSRPERSDVSWKEIERILAALGARIREGNFSRVRIELNGVKAVFQRPLGDQTNRNATVSVARFLREVKLDLNEI
jgi:hypothetical protein